MRHPAERKHTMSSEHDYEVYLDKIVNLLYDIKKELQEIRKSINRLPTELSEGR